MTMDTITVLAAKYLYLVSILAALIFFLRQPRPRQAQLVAFAVVYLPAVVVIARAAALCYFDPRPFVLEHIQPLVLHEADNGFVSDHSLLASAVATLVAYFQRRLGLVLWVLACVVGAARVYVGLHHPIDVLAAFAISAALSPLAYFVARRWIAPAFSRLAGRSR